MSIIETMNTNILNRFESKNSSTIGSRKYTIKFTDGKTASMICMNGENVQEAEIIAISKFGSSRVLGVYP